MTANEAIEWIERHDVTVSSSNTQTTWVSVAHGDGILEGVSGHGETVPKAIESFLRRVELAREILSKF